MFCVQFSHNYIVMCCQEFTKLGIHDPHDEGFYIHKGLTSLATNVYNWPIHYIYISGLY